MGYRSQVVYAIEPARKTATTPVDKWFVFLAEARNCPTTQLAMQMIDRGGEWADKPKEVWWRGGLDSKNNSILMEFEDVKWYDSFDEPQSFKALFDMIEQDYTDEIHAGYVRVGEEQDDIETYYVNEGYELVRGISYYEVDGSSYQQCDFEQDEITRRSVSTNLDSKRQQDVDDKIASGIMINKEKESEHEL